MEKKITIVENVKGFDYLMSSLGGSIDGAIDWLEHIKEECEKAGYIGIWLENEYDFSDDENLIVRGERWETDKEFEKRIKKEKKKKQKEKEKEQEIKLLKKLQRKCKENMVMSDK